MKNITYYFMVMIIISSTSTASDFNEQILQDKKAITSYNSSPYNSKETKFLEEAEGKEAIKWARQETEKSKKLLKATNVYKKVQKTVESILYDQRKTPFGHIYKGHVYNFWTDDQNPQGLWRRTLLTNYHKEKPEWEILIDFDKLSKKLGKKIVFRNASNAFSNSDLYLVQMSFGGKDETFFQEWNLKTKDFVSNGFKSQTSNGRIVEGKFAGGIWLDEDTIIFSSVLNADDVTKSLYPNSLYLWRRTEKIEQAKKILEIPKDYISISFGKLLSDNISSSLVYIAAAKDFYNNDYYILDINQKLQKIFIPSDAELKGSFKEYVFILLRSDWQIGSTIKAGSLISLHWRDLLKDDKNKTSLKILFTPTEKTVFDFVAVTKDTVFIATYDNVISKVSTLTLENDNWTEPTELILPYEKSIFSISSEEEETDALVTVENAIVPPTIYLWNKTHTLSLIRKALYPFDSSQYVFEQYEVSSADGVKIPYFIIYKRGMQFNGINPTLLTAYGGFQIINLAGFDRKINELWIKNGGVMVIANIRGGGEFGPAWHKAAMAEKRQTGFNDFIAVAEDLIRRNITTPLHLGIKGGSNGGLLVSAVMVKRPDLFSAVACEVPLLDMVRYTEFGAGHSWIAEYGDPTNPKTLSYIKQYAPLENISLTQKYPSILITSSVQDQRVHPWHARIFYYVLSKNPNTKSYFLESSDMGHNGSGLKDEVDYDVDLYSFFVHMLKLKVE